MLHPGITINPKRMGGVPCIRDLRIPVETVVALVLQGSTREDILAAYPDLRDEDIDNALGFAREVLYEYCNSQESSSQDLVCPA